MSASRTNDEGLPAPLRIDRFKKAAEDTATKVFERLHGIRHRRPELSIVVGRGPIKISRAELRNLVWSKTMIRAAKDLGISEFTLRNICKRLQIPTPPRGHFNHKNPKECVARHWRRSKSDRLATAPSQNVEPPAEAPLRSQTRQVHA